MPTFKKKKRVNAVKILHGLVIRRRLNYLLPVISTVVACVVFIYAVLSFLIPPINDISMLRDRTRFEVVFRVPNNGGELNRDIWNSMNSELYHGCSNASHNFPVASHKTEPNRYLVIATSGGLNQQRTGITDAVVAAYILNATLVVPKLDQQSYWKDKSNFTEIFDVDRFISYLSKDVKIIKQLPTIGGKNFTPYSTRVPRKCTPKYYLDRILPLLEKKHVVQLSKFDYRLSNRIDKELQKLRCRVNYHALKFTQPITDLGKKLIERMRTKCSKFIALHLRFESDMLAFSRCYYGGGEKERTELGSIRKRWKSLHVGNPERERRRGKCPLTPEEVGLILRALGYNNDVHIYIASGEVYGGENTLAPLKALFPNLHTKETIATKEELAPFSSFSARMAALDFIVCDESDVFVTNNNGNMARMLAGRRKYFGHKPTIRPSAKKLYRLFMNKNNMTWEEFELSVRSLQIGFMGEPNEVKPGRGEFHENPWACICKDSKAQFREDPGLELGTENSLRSDVIDEDEQNWSDTEYLDSDKRILPNRTDSDSGVVIKPDQPEADEAFSD